MFKHLYALLREVEFYLDGNASAGRRALCEAEECLEHGRVHRAVRLARDAQELILDAIASKERLALTKSVRITCQGQFVTASYDGAVLSVGLWGDGGNSTTERTPGMVNTIRTCGKKVSMRTISEDGPVHWLYQVYTEETFLWEGLYVTLNSRMHGHGFEEKMSVVCSAAEAADICAIIQNEAQDIEYTEIILCENARWRAFIDYVDDQAPLNEE